MSDRLKIFRHFGVWAMLCIPLTNASGQRLSELPASDRVSILERPTAQAQAKEDALIEKVYEPELLLRLEPAQSKILRTKVPIARTVISHPEIIDIQIFDALEVELVGKTAGETTLTLWFAGADGTPRVLRYLVVVEQRQQEQRRRELRYRALQSRINELFPDSQVFLIPVEDKLIVRGQASDAQAAAEILRVLGAGSAASNGRRGDTRYRNDWPFGDAQDRYGDDGFDDPDGRQVINLLRVPGTQQVMLKVRVAELVRNSNRALGAELSAIMDSVQLSHLISGGGNASAILHNGDVEFFLRAVSTHGYGKILAEPTLVTISGKTAQFLAGGEFAVPTTVGIEGASAATTSFRGFGTELHFTPTVLDKDLIRLEVAPSFSTLNADATVGGIPGLNRRRVETTVDLREGQWLAIAGLIQDELGGQRTKLPYLGDLPLLGGLFATQSSQRFETELVVLVSPELIHPLEAEQVGLPLPGMEVTEATDDDFFGRHLIEGYAGVDHRSTVWPGLKKQRTAAHRSRRRMTPKRAMAVHGAYISGSCGFSE